MAHSTLGRVSDYEVSPVLLRSLNATDWVASRDAAQDNHNDDRSASPDQGS